MSRSHGVGQPNWFFCRQCRIDGSHRRGHGGPNEVHLTGKVRHVLPRHGGGARVAGTRYEYECTHCGHVGWSRHFVIALKADREGIAPHPRDTLGQKRFNAR